jgi:hypothetical protein
MANLFGRNWTRRELMERVGDISQLGGIRTATLNDGNENSVRTVEVRTGTGFRFVVLPDRGMDISEADHAGRSLCWRSGTGDVAPAFFEPVGRGWLRGFFGGLLVTCGLTYVGPSGTDEGETLGQHGRISFIPARNVQADGEWQGDEYVMWVRGKVSETTSMTPKLTMTRKISTRLGANSVTVEDTVENEGHTPSPFMMLYHLNFGFPLVSAETELLSPTRSVVTMAREKVTDPDLYRRFQNPVAGFQDSVLRHEVVPGSDGYVTAALINKGMAPFGAYVRYLQKELPHLWQWTMLAQGVYTLVLEPANCWIEPRSEARKRGELKFLEPGQVISQHLEIGVCTSREEVEGLGACRR